MDTYIPIDQAAKLVDSSIDDLLLQVKHGKIKAVMTSSGVVMVREKDILSDIRNHPDFSQYADLDGKEILAIRASEKYGVPTGTISKWIKRGWVKVIRRSTKRVWLDEASFAFMANRYKISPGQGKKHHAIK